MKFAESYLKAIERRNELLAAKNEQEKIDPLEMVDQPGMEIQERVLILTDYVEELDAHIADARDKLRELIKEWESTDAELLQGLSGVVSEEGGVPELRLLSSDEPGAPDGEAELSPLQGGGDGGLDAQEGDSDSETGEERT